MKQSKSSEINYFRLNSFLEVDKENKLKKSGTAAANPIVKEQTSESTIEELRKALYEEKEKNYNLQKELTDEKQKLKDKYAIEEKLSSKYESAKQAIEQEYKNDLELLQKKLQNEIEEKEQLQLRYEQTEAALKMEKEQLQLRLNQAEAALNQKMMVEKRDSDVPSNISFWEVSHLDIQINEHIGAGAWGYVAKGVYKEQQVAVKCLHPNIVSPHSLKLLKREVAMMAKIRHPCLLLFIAVSFDHPSGSPMIITELMDCSLRDGYKKKGMLISGRSKIRIMIDVACALHYLHTHKERILHRDVSSANVLIHQTIADVYHGKLSDFGSANFARQAVTAGPGAEMYMAPEVPRETFSSSSIAPHQTTKIDVYSYGVLLCEVFASEPQLPFREVFPSLLESIKSRFPFMYEQILQCTNQNPDNRPEIKDVLCELKTKFQK